MSADRWSVCPRCQHERDTEISKEEGRVEALYGAVPVEEFDDARQKLAELKEESLSPTFREDWEMADPSSDGVLDIYYKGHCGACELSFKIEHHHEIWKPES